MSKGLSVIASLSGSLEMAKQAEKIKEFSDVEEKRRLEEERIAEERRQEYKRICREKEKTKKNKRQIFAKRFKAFLLNKKKIQIDYSADYLVSKNVNDVFEVLRNSGFKNVNTIPIKDIYTESQKKENEVEQVLINGRTWVNENDWIPYDAEIIVIYHLKMEFEIPYSSKQMIKRNYEELAQELLSIGFTEVYTEGLEDLKIGWIKKENSVQKVIVGGEESYKRGKIVVFDTRIIILYHSFTKKR